MSSRFDSQILVALLAAALACLTAANPREGASGGSNPQNPGQNINDVLQEKFKPDPGSVVQIAPMIKQGDPTPGEFSKVDGGVFDAIFKRVGIDTCKTDPKDLENKDGYLEYIEAPNSQVLNSEGSRTTFGYFVKITREGIGGEFFVLFSYDRDGKDKSLCATELFLFGPFFRTASGKLTENTPPKLVMGVAVGTDGRLLDEVPLGLAKVSNFPDFAGKKSHANESVKPGVDIYAEQKGCLLCHQTSAAFPQSTLPFPWTMPPASDDSKTATQPKVSQPGDSPQPSTAPQDSSGAGRNSSNNNSGRSATGVPQAPSSSPPPTSKPTETGETSPSNKDTIGESGALSERSISSALQNGFGKTTPLLPPGYQAKLNPDGTYTLTTPDGKTYHVTRDTKGDTVFEEVHVSNAIGVSPVLKPPDGPPSTADSTGGKPQVGNTSNSTSTGPHAVTTPTPCQPAPGCTTGACLSGQTCTSGTPPQKARERPPTNTAPIPTGGKPYSGEGGLATLGNVMSMTGGLEPLKPKGDDSGTPQPQTSSGNEPAANTTGGAVPVAPAPATVQAVSEVVPCSSQDECDRRKTAAEQADKDAIAAKAAVAQAEADQQKVIQDAYHLDTEAENQGLLHPENRISENLAVSAAKHKQAQMLRDSAAAAVAKAKADAVAKAKAAADAHAATDACRTCPEEHKTALTPGTNVTPQTPNTNPGGNAVGTPKTDPQVAFSDREEHSPVDGFETRTTHRNPDGGYSVEDSGHQFGGYRSIKSRYGPDGKLWTRTSFVDSGNPTSSTEVRETFGSDGILVLTTTEVRETLGSDGIVVTTTRKWTGKKLPSNPPYSETTTRSSTPGLEQLGKGLQEAAKKEEERAAFRKSMWDAYRESEEYRQVFQNPPPSDTGDSFQKSLENSIRQQMEDENKKAKEVPRKESEKRDISESTPVSVVAPSVTPIIDPSHPNLMPPSGLPSVNGLPTATFNPGALPLVDLTNLSFSQFGSAPVAPAVQYIIVTINVGGAGPGPTAESRRPRVTPRSGGTFQNIVFHPREAFALSARGGTSGPEVSSGSSGGTSTEGGMAFSLAASGTLGSGALEFRVLDPSGRVKNIAIPEGVVLEPLRPGVMRPVGGNAVSRQLTAYCLEMAKLPPEPGQLYRIAPQAVQDRFKPLKSVLEAGSKLAASGQFHPDSDPKAYTDFIRQHALWAQLENWSEQKFTEVFVERTKKNAEHMKMNWTKEMEKSLRSAAPGRWQDIAMVLEEAQKLASAPGAATTAQQPEQ